MRLERVFFLLGGDQIDQNVVPSRSDRLQRRSNAAFISKIDKLPARDLEERVASARGSCFGMHDFAVAKKHQATLGFFNQLERAAAPAETTHLQNISLNRFRKNLGRGNFQALLRSGVIWKKQNLKRWINLAE